MLCLYCDSNISSSGSVFCRKHLLRNRRKARERTAKFAALGVCTICGIRKPKTTCTNCRLCIRKRTLLFKREQKRRKSKGLCLRCGKHPQYFSVMCRGCRIKNNRRIRSVGFFTRKARTVVDKDSKVGSRDFKASDLASILQIIWEKQKGLCALSGRKLTKLRAHVDHIRPRSKGGRSVETNLRFLDKDINQAKRALTDVEFITLCQNVVSFVEGRT